MMRQLARTVTDHSPFRSPLSGCRRYRGRSRAFGVLAASRTVSDAFNRLYKVWPYSAAAAALIEAFQRSMLKALDHPEPECKVTIVTCQVGFVSVVLITRWPFHGE